MYFVQQYFQQPEATRKEKATRKLLSQEILPGAVIPWRLKSPISFQTLTP